MKRELYETKNTDKNKDIVNVMKKRLNDLKDESAKMSKD